MRMHGTLLTTRFPPQNATNGKGKAGRGIGPHTDYGLLVIAAQDQVGGEPTKTSLYTLAKMFSRTIRTSATTRREVYQLGTECCELEGKRRRLVVRPARFGGAYCLSR